MMLNIKEQIQNEVKDITNKYIKCAEYLDDIFKSFEVDELIEYMKVNKYVPRVEVNGTEYGLEYVDRFRDDNFNSSMRMTIYIVLDETYDYYDCIEDKTKKYNKTAWLPLDSYYKNANKGRFMKRKEIIELIIYLDTVINRLIEDISRTLEIEFTPSKE